ncbi:hypothetical protein P2318_12830 [Myxococcaceae bacterium GXIMD 01537]
MIRGGVLALALACAVVPGAAVAQVEDAGTVVGLPIVVKEGGWARYTTENEDGEPVELAIRVGPTGDHKGRSGRWLIMETHMPEVGRVSMEFLVVGPIFDFPNFALVRARMPGQPAKEAVPEKPPKTTSKPQVLRKASEQVAGQSIPIVEYEMVRGQRAVWSPSVPGLGLVRVKGEGKFDLVAFGVGGDPWKSAAVAPIWPKEEEKKAPSP